MKNEQDISDDVAKEKYGITKKFSVMSTNGETRFRLICNDGTAYIRTETKDEAEGWQNAHYHRGLSETCIVQKGSILFVEIKENEIFSRLYKAGEMFTIANNVPHNVYMMKNSIIHTIKHGKPEIHPNKMDDKADWWNDIKGCKELNSLRNSIEEIIDKTEKIDEQPEQINKSNIIVVEEKESPYNTAYIHFDNLIWQFPAWIFGLLTIGIAMIGLLGQNLSTNMNLFYIENVSIKMSYIISFALIGFGVLGMILAYSMHRFRYHQAKLKDGGKRKIISPQIFIQVFSNVLIVILFLLGFGFIGVLTIKISSIVFISSVIISIVLEIILWIFTNKTKKHEGNIMS